jgi:preprotein translocase subunit SecA
MRVEVSFEAPPQPAELPPMEYVHPDPAAAGGEQAALAELNARLAASDFSPQVVGGDAATAEAPARDPGNPATWGKVGRNEPCPCGSGKKFKHCHGALV